jgi:hypothetical protein
LGILGAQAASPPTWGSQGEARKKNGEVQQSGKAAQMRRLSTDDKTFKRLEDFQQMRRVSTDETTFNR